MSISQCFSCGGSYPDIDGPTHPYMKSTPGCWAVYGEVLAREYGNPEYFDVHRLTVDAYAVQHPGATDRRSVQSVGVHLIRLCLFFEQDLAGDKANQAMKNAVRLKHEFHWLQPPQSLGGITAADVAHAGGVDEHRAIVNKWARGAWDAWSLHHPTVRSWIS